MNLRQLLQGLNITASTGSLDIDVTGIVSDNREVKLGNVFVCYQGISIDSHIFVSDAVQRGAVVVIGEKPIAALTTPNFTHTDKIGLCSTLKRFTYIQVPNGRRAMSLISANWHENPAKQLKLIGITGTNGKTSTAHLIYAILKASGRKVALIGTVGHRYTNAHGVEKKLPAFLTTPDAFALHALFKQFVEEGVEYVTMETSSQGLALQRLAGLTFDTAVFTNFTQDHLDYHQTMEEYLKAKLMLFEQLRKDGVAVLNGDLPVTERITQACAGSKRLMYGHGNNTDLHAEDIELSRTQLAFTAVFSPNGLIPAKLRLLGEYNLYNALAAIAVGVGYNCSVSAIQEGLAATVVPGRFELVDRGQDFAVIVDYAHTPDGLENILTAAKRITERKLISVFGCGGDRDNGKRPKMGNISAQIADYSVITSDNPRTEDPDKIIAQIVSNLPHDAKYVCVSERREAIHHAITTAESGDVVVIAGKGHEDYQEIHGKRFPFDDRIVASDILESL